MLRDLTLLILLLNSGLLAFAGKPVYAVCLLIVAILVFRLKSAYSHNLEKELNLLSSHLLKKQLAVFVASLAIVAVTFLELKETVPLFSALSLSISPLLLILVFRQKVALSTSQIGQFRVIRLLRIILQLKAAQFIVVALGIMGLLEFRLLPALTFIQILAIETALLAPLFALQHDNNRLKLLKVTHHNLRNHTLSKQALHGYLGYGLIAAVLTYANYLLFFVRHNLNPYYLDPSLPLYQQATTLSMATFVFIMILAVMFERVDKHEFFINEHTLDNIKLIKAFGLATLMVAVFAYVPGLKEFLQTAPLDIYDWLTALFVAAVYAGLRMVKRGSRKHSRQAVIRLHKQVHAKR